MKKLVMGGIVVLGVVVFATAVLAQPQGKCPASSAWPMGRMYDPKTVETLRGEIVAVEKVTAGKMDVPARVLLKLKTSKETATIYLGPEWYLEQQGVKLVAGDQVEVRGSRVTLDNETVILPNEVKKGERVLKFWDEQGMPGWRGQGPGRGGQGRGRGAK